MANSKKIIIIAATAVVLVAVAVLALVLIRPAVKVEEISIGRNEMPKVTYVQGQSLDLTGGQLTVVYSDGTTETLSLDAEGITISGFDSSTPGTQTVTVGYGEQAFQFQVMVIARIRVENAQTVYYEGESLDTSRGRLVIANDDATTFNVPFSADTVSFSGFDSSAPVTDQTVTVRYLSGEADYSTSFRVSVYTTDNARLTPPTKTSYQTHETFQINGAYLTYSNGDPSYDKNIPITEDMISGLDFSAVTPENSPMTQNVTVSYGGHEYPFTVTITYSKVTALQKLMAEYAFVWNEPEIPEVTAETGERALECLELYLALSATEQTYVEDISTVVRLAAVYTAEQWRTELAALEECFFIEDASIRYTLTSYAATAAALATVSDDAAALNADLSVFERFLVYFPAQTVGGETMGDYLADVSAYRSARTNLTALLQLLTTMYEGLEGVPSDAADLTAYASEIGAVLTLIRERSAQEDLSEYRQLLAQMSTWREQNDYFDILYAYCLQQEDADSINLMKGIVLPATLEEIYNSLFDALIQYVRIFQNRNTSDGTLLVYYYRAARTLANEVIAGDNAVLRELYDTLTFDDLLADSSGESMAASFEDLFTFVSRNYYNLISEVMDDPDLTALWDAYLGLLETTNDEIGPQLKAVVAAFGELTPGQQKAFLYSTNYYYTQYQTPALDLESGYSVFVRLIDTYYGELLNEDEYAMLADLLKAVEYYASISESETALQSFLTAMNTVTGIYQTAGDKADFVEHFGAIYDRCAAYAGLYDETGALKTEFSVPAEWQEKLDALATAVKNVFAAEALIQAPDAEDGTSTAQSAYIRLYASYETLRVLLDQILTQAPESVLAAYRSELVTFGTYSWTLDYAVSVQVGGMAVWYYSAITYGNEFRSSPLWEIIADMTEMRSFIARAESVLWAEADAEFLPDAETAAQLMKDFVAFTVSDRMLFFQLQDLDENHAYYYDGLRAVFRRHFADSQTLTAAADALVDLEPAMLEYLRQTEGEGELTEEELAELEAARQAAQAALDAVDQALAALGETERAAFDALFADFLTHYREAFAGAGVQDPQPNA